MRPGSLVSRLTRLRVMFEPTPAKHLAHSLSATGAALPLFCAVAHLLLSHSHGPLILDGLSSSDTVHLCPARRDLVQVVATFSGSLQKLSVKPLFRQIACRFQAGIPVLGVDPLSQALTGRRAEVHNLWRLLWIDILELLPFLVFLIDPRDVTSWQNFAGSFQCSGKTVASSW